MWGELHDAREPLRESIRRAARQEPYSILVEGGQTGPGRDMRQAALDVSRTSPLAPFQFSFALGARLYEGDYFGDVCLVLGKTPRTAWIRSEAFIVTSRLDKDRLDGVVEDLRSRMGGRCGTGVRDGGVGRVLLRPGILPSRPPCSTVRCHVVARRVPVVSVPSGCGGPACVGAGAQGSSAVARLARWGAHLRLVNAEVCLQKMSMRGVPDALSKTTVLRCQDEATRVESANDASRRTVQTSSLAACAQTRLFLGWALAMLSKQLVSAFCGRPSPRQPGGGSPVIALEARQRR